MLRGGERRPALGALNFTYLAFLTLGSGHMYTTHIFVDYLQSYGAWIRDLLSAC
jgi:hypothetical protein